MTVRFTVLFEPLDVLQFRDHRPFDMGEHAVAKTVFPGPATFRGALRTLLFRGLGARFDHPSEHFGVEPRWAQVWLGGRHEVGTIAIRGPLLAKLTSGGPEPFETYFHPPRDVVPGEPRGRFRPLLARQAPSSAQEQAPGRFRWRDGALRTVGGALPWAEVEPEKHSGPGYLTAAGAREYLAAGAAGLELGGGLSVKEDRLLRHEPRVGIARDGATLAAEDRMFYLTAPYRMAPEVGFAIDVVVPEEEAARRLAALRGAVTPLGGKAHRARVHVVEQPLVPADLAPDTAGGPLRIWLQTALRLPVPFPEGALVISDRPVPVGGFDFARGAPRPLRSALAPGTVIHLPAGARWPLSDDDAGTGYGFALAGPIPQLDSSPKGES